MNITYVEKNFSRNLDKDSLRKWNLEKDDLELVGIYDDQKNYFYMSKYKEDYNYLNTIFKHMNPKSFLNRVVKFFEKKPDFMKPVLKAFSKEPEDYIKLLDNGSLTSPINFTEDLGMMVFYQDGDSGVANDLGWGKKVRDYNCIPLSIPFDVVTYPHNGIDMDLKRGWYKIFKNFLRNADLKSLCKRVMRDDDRAEAFKAYLELYMEKSVSNKMFSLGVLY